MRGSALLSKLSLPRGLEGEPLLYVPRNFEKQTRFVASP
jgi:hypothetical protein